MMHLINSYQPLVRWVCQFNQPEVMALEFATFRQQTEAHFADALCTAHESGLGDEDLDNARFAMVVWFDEMVLRSSLTVKQQWRNTLLQTQWYNTVIGGEEFFSRLDGLTEKQKNVRMVYLYCLLMGFHGKYHYQDASQLVERIRNERQFLPAEWSDWPNNAAITPLNDRNDNNIFEGYRRLLRNKYSLIIIPGICYAMSGLLLSFS
ncbi:DotU family type IV/VI secretion system protein [Pantoea sp. SO10]|uniref:DotU family type IV/VI secretion system protein n=1 Tax=Pantoea sp. SO10 TaxID=2575375 RepID=UPI0010C93CB9|nr:DotU family type IV/VI secretion system protein [Pantoea sp. SO10]QCP59334.1 DotU family type IV/VI secretion system protein [Pantoea sp. SO10]